MLVSQSVVVTVPTVEAALLRVLDSSPYPRAFYLHNLETANTLTIKVESSPDGGVTYTQVGATLAIAPGAMSPVWLVAAGPLIRLKGSGNGKMYVGLARFQQAIDPVLTIVNL